MYVIAPNQIGPSPSGIADYGHSLIVDPWGTPLARASNVETAILAEIDLDYLARVRRELPCLEHRTFARVKAFFRVVSTDEARDLIRATPALRPETVAVQDAARRVLAQETWSRPVDLPHFHRANMDGYAVRAADTFGASASVPAYLQSRRHDRDGTRGDATAAQGRRRCASPPAGCCRAGADAVVMVEHADEVGDGSVEVHRSVSPWQHVLRIGEDIAAGRARLRRPVGGCARTISAR